MAQDEPVPENIYPHDMSQEVWLFVNDLGLGDRVNSSGNMRPVPYVAKGSGRTLIPIRLFSEGIGGEVNWHPETRQVSLRMLGKSITMRIDDPTAWVDGTPFVLDQPPVIRLDRTFVPLRFVMEVLGAKVEYFGLTNPALVHVTSPDFTCSHPVNCQAAGMPFAHVKVLLCGRECHRALQKP